jgi:hypothetical protein
MKTMLMVLPLLLAAGCLNAHGGDACMRVTERMCDVCPKTDDRARLCKCLDEGTLTASDYEGTEITDDEAARVCSQVVNNLRFPGSETAASCRADLAFLREWDVDACGDLGWRAD